MALRKITIDNSVRYIPQSEHTRESKPNVIKNTSIPSKENEQSNSISKGGKINTIKTLLKENFRKIMKNSSKDFAAGGFGILTK